MERCLHTQSRYVGTNKLQHYESDAISQTRLLVQRLAPKSIMINRIPDCEAIPRDPARDVLPGAAIADCTRGMDGPPPRTES